MKTVVSAPFDPTTPNNYLYLPGRAGGQSAIGGTGNGDPLSFTATSGTAGPINFYATPGSRIGILTISNLAFGLSAQANMGAGTDNIAIGRLAMGVGATTGLDNIAIGRSSLEDCLTGRENVVLGYQAGANLTTGRFNIIVGSTAMSAGTVTGDDNVIIGYGAALNVATASETIAIGLGSMGTGVVTGANNIGIGQNTLEDCTSGNVNVAIGYQALLNLTTGATNVAIGSSALGLGIVTGSYNVAYGFRAAYNLTSGAYSVAIGYLAMGAGVVTGADNIAIGQTALNVLTSGANNIGIGRSAGILVTTGTLNTYLGALAGSTGVNAATLTKSAAIGYNALVSASSTMVLGGTGADVVAVVIGATAAVNEEVLSVIGGIYTANAGAAIYWESGDGASAGVSKAATGRIRYNNGGTGTFQISTQTGAYSDILTTASAGLANYFYLPGRAGGQIGYGSTLASENLTLSATSNGTPGSVIICATGTTPIATINQYGVGIGVTPTEPTAKLNIVGNVAAVTRGVITNNNGVSGYSTWLVDNGSHSGGIGISVNAGSALTTSFGVPTTTLGLYSTTGIGICISPNNGTTTIRYKRSGTFVDALVVSGTADGAETRLKGAAATAGGYARLVIDNGTYGLFLGMNGTAATPANMAYVQYGGPQELRIWHIAAQPITFYTSNTERMRILSGGTLCINATAAIGTEKLYVNGGVNISDTGNLTWAGALKNIRIGNSALANLTTGTYNVAIGESAMGAGVVTGADNIAIGQQALEDATSAATCIAIGKSAGLNLTTATDCIAIGDLAMGSGIVTALDSIALGRNSLNILTSGADNIGIGRSAGILVTTGTLNTYVGALAGSTGVNAATLTKSAAFGYNALVSASNTMVLGGTGADAVAVCIGATAAVGTEKLLVVGGFRMDADGGFELASQTDHAGAQAGTIANAPVAGDPAIWFPVVINGTTRLVPAWAHP